MGLLMRLLGRNVRHTPGSACGSGPHATPIPLRPPPVDDGSRPGGRTASVDTVTTPQPRFVVDTDELQRALSVLAEVGTAMTQLRMQLRHVLADAPVWAADSDVLPAVQALVDTLDAAGRRGQVDAADLADAIKTAADRYTRADLAATASARDSSRSGR
jgi:hypothetical protein